MRLILAEYKEIKRVYVLDCIRNINFFIYEKRAITIWSVYIYVNVSIYIYIYMSLWQGWKDSESQLGYIDTTRDCGTFFIVYIYYIRKISFFLVYLNVSHLYQLPTCSSFAIISRLFTTIDCRYIYIYTYTTYRWKRKLNRMIQVNCNNDYNSICNYTAAQLIYTWMKELIST